MNQSRMKFSFKLVTFLPWHFDVVDFDIVIGPPADIDCSDYKSTQPEVPFGD